MWIIIAYLILINALSFILMHMDKRHARKKKQRIAESVLFLVAIAGGSPGILLGMYAFRHKTKHVRFTGGIPLILTLQILLVFVVLTVINSAGSSDRFGDNLPQYIPGILRLF